MQQKEATQQKIQVLLLALLNNPYHLTCPSGETSHALLMSAGGSAL